MRHISIYMFGMLYCRRQRHIQFKQETIPMGCVPPLVLTVHALITTRCQHWWGRGGSWSEQVWTGHQMPQVGQGVRFHVWRAGAGGPCTVRSPCPEKGGGMPVQCSPMHHGWSHGTLPSLEQNCRNDWKYYLPATSPADGNYVYFQSNAFHELWWMKGENIKTLTPAKRRLENANL